MVTSLFRTKMITQTTASLALLAMLSGCGELLFVEGASTVVTDKTFSDHIVSFYSKKDCSTVRKELGMTYCKEDDLQLLKPDSKQYCYRELGKVTCYEQQDLQSHRKTIEEKAPAAPDFYQQ